MRGNLRDRRFLSLAAFLLLIPGLASASPEEPRRTVDVRRVLELRPLPGAEVVVPGFKAFFLSDGSVTISGKGRARAGAPTSGFDFEVDLASGTYTTRRLDPSEIEERRPLQEAFGENRQPGRPGRSGEPPQKITAAVLPGTWWGRVRVQTRDPLLVVLTETTTELTWTVDSGGTVSWISYGDGCWAANPSSLGTHWFVSSCQLGGPWYPSATRVCNENRGYYYNWDFEDENLRTDVSQWSWMCGRNDALYDFNWSHNDSGEFSLLIYGSVVLN